MNKLIINLVPTGMIPTKAMTPHVPLSPEEIVEDVLKCFPLGVSMVHIHARDSEGVPTYKPEIFREIIINIRRRQPDLIIAATTSGRTYKEFAGRSAVLDLEGDARPDMASLTLSSVNFNKIASVNSPDVIVALAEKMREKGIKPELEIFDLGMVNFAHYLIRKDLLTPPIILIFFWATSPQPRQNCFILELLFQSCPRIQFGQLPESATCNAE